MKTPIRRNWLVRQIQQGNVEARCTMRLTDDFAHDNATEFGKTAWQDCQIITNEDQRDQTKVNLYPFEFTTQSGRAYRNDDGTFELTVHTGTYYELRLKDTVPEIPAKKNKDA